MKISIKETIIVEGKYDKIKLSNIFDADILVTNGFSFFNDEDKKDLIIRLSKSGGIIIVTDSDSAGFMIRNHIKSFCDSENIINVYIPELYGKEKRKTAPSKEGLLGVEGVPDSVITEAFRKAGVIGEKAPRKRLITKLDLYNLGLVGNENSSVLRESLLKNLSLPKKLSTAGMLEMLNKFFTLEELEDEVKSLK